MGLPEPTTLDAAFESLAKIVLNACGAGQQLEIGDSVGGSDVPAILKKFCEEQEIAVSHLKDVHSSLQSLKRWSCKITKLEKVSAW